MSTIILLSLLLCTVRSQPTIVDGIWHDDYHHVNKTIFDYNNDTIFDDGWVVFNGKSGSEYRKKVYHLQDDDIGGDIWILDAFKSPIGPLGTTSYFEGVPISLVTSDYSEAPGQSFHGPYQASMKIDDYYDGGQFFHIVRNFQCPQAQSIVTMSLIYWYCGWKNQQNGLWNLQLNPIIPGNSSNNNLFHNKVRNAK